MNTIVVNINYDDLDFGGLFHSEQDDLTSNIKYDINITDFEGEICNEFNYMKVRSFLYQTYQGSKIGWYGHLGINGSGNYVIIVEKNSKYMCVRYCTKIIHAINTCNFTLNSMIYNSLREAWSSLDEKEKTAMIKGCI